MDNNENIEFLLSQYLDGQLNDADEARLMEAMDKDPALRAEMQQFAKLDEMLLAKKDDPALRQVDFDLQRQQIMAAVERKALLAVPRKVNVIRIAFGALAAAACVAIAISLALVTLKPSPPTGPGSGPEMVFEMLPEVSGGGEVSLSMVPVAQESEDSVVITQVPELDLMSIPLGGDEPMGPATAMMFSGEQQSNLDQPL